MKLKQNYMNVNKKKSADSKNKKKEKKELKKSVKIVDLKKKSVNKKK